MYSMARKALFCLPPEMSHYISLDAISAAGRLNVTQTLFPSVYAPVEVMGLSFANSVGLAAGLDKDGDHIDGLAALGFGFIEIGTVTPRPQSGNPSPRLFRIPEKQAIINRMGFNNKGIDHLVRQVKKSKYNGVLGINIGKNFDTPVEDALDDYLICLRKAYPLASYIVINISSPNTPGLRKLQYGESLDHLLSNLKNEQQKLEAKHGKKVPLAVKIAPDLEINEIEMIAKQLITNNIDAVIATNTTLDRDGVSHLSHGNEQGGLSGAPVKAKSTAVIRELAKHLDGTLPIIGVGGITTANDAQEKIDAGASLVQIYTGFIYEGPDLIRESAKRLARHS
ncbi:dihydroorotate dehydrogenase (quinone) [Gammaproteobacteria bacterium 42_54_T18]|nr:dihydroorotate dehydrogenase (quinone) [Gammaproteobacteria bacterium 42_54_T18]